MNPLYEDGVESMIGDIVLAHCIGSREDGWGGYVEVDYGDRLAKVIDLHPENKKKFEIEFLDKSKDIYKTRVEMCRLADYRDFKNRTEKEEVK